MAWTIVAVLSVIVGALIGYGQKDGLTPILVFALISLATILIGDFYEVRGQLVQTLFQSDSLIITVFSYFMLSYITGWFLGIVTGRETNIKPPV